MNSIPAKEAKRFLLASRLPDGFTVQGNLEIHNCNKLDALPEGLVVGLVVKGNLKLGSCPQFTTLPKSIRVKNYCIIRYFAGLAHLTKDDGRAATGARNIVLGEDYPF